MDEVKLPKWDYMYLDTIKFYPFYESNLAKLVFEEELNFWTAKELQYMFERKFKIQKEKMQRELWNQFDIKHIYGQEEWRYTPSGHYYERIMYSIISLEGHSEQGDSLILEITPNLFTKNGRIMIIDEEYAKAKWIMNLSKETDLFMAKTLKGFFSISPGQGGCETYFDILNHSKRQNGYFQNATSRRF